MRRFRRSRARQARKLARVLLTLEQAAAEARPRPAPRTSVSIAK